MWREKSWRRCQEIFRGHFSKNLEGKKVNVSIITMIMCLQCLEGTLPLTPASGSNLVANNNNIFSQTQSWCDYPDHRINHVRFKCVKVWPWTASIVAKMKRSSGLDHNWRHRNYRDLCRWERKICWRKMNACRLVKVKTKYIARLFFCNSSDNFCWDEIKSICCFAINVPIYLFTLKKYKASINLSRVKKHIKM